MSTLYIVGTPIGNLEDITLRALRILKEADIVLAEDTRVTQKLLNHYEIKANVVRYDEHRHSAVEEMVLEALREGSDIALVSDAGMPTISDPGHRLVERVHMFSQEEKDIKVESVPGPSSLTAALSLSGISSSQFTFFGFLPQKKGKQTVIEVIKESKNTSVFFESPHRIEKTLNLLLEHLDWNRKVSVVKEITKIHENVITGTLREVADYISSHQDIVKGEFVVVIEGV